MSWLLGAYSLLKNRAAQVALLGALILAGTLYLYLSIQRGARTRVEAEAVKQSMEKIREAIKARNRARRDLADDDRLYEDDGHRRD